MNQLQNQDLCDIQQVAVGPFSFHFEGERMTAAILEQETVMFFASTYVAMIRFGWAPEVIS